MAAIISVWFCVGVSRRETRSENLFSLKAVHPVFHDSSMLAPGCVGDEVTLPRRRIKWECTQMILTPFVCGNPEISLWFTTEAQPVWRFSDQMIDWKYVVTLYQIFLKVEFSYFLCYLCYINAGQGLFSPRTGDSTGNPLNTKLCLFYMDFWV